MKVLDLFSAAAGGWSLGLHRAGFETVAACEVVPWRRELYAQNFPNVRLYDDVRTLTADRLRADLGALPDCIVGSPPCQDISSANTKGQGVDGARSGLFFEAVRIVGECRPRWVALENSPRVRTKGYDRIASRMEALGYAGEPCVVGADDVLANHERKRGWLLFWDPEQLADPDGFRRHAGRSGRGLGIDLCVPENSEHTEGLRHEGGRAWRRGSDGFGSSSTACCDAADAQCGELRIKPGRCSGTDGRGAAEPEGFAGHPDVSRLALGQGIGRNDGQEQPAAERTAGDGRDNDGDAEGDGWGPGRARRRAVTAEGLRVPPCGDAACPHPDDEGQPDGAEHDEVGGGEGLGRDAAGPWSEWNGGLADHLRLDDGLSAWVAQSRIAVGGPRGTAAAGLLVEAFGDAVLPQIPEAIGRAILRTEAALAAIYGAAA